MTDEPPAPITVVLADDHAIVRAGTRAALGAHGGFAILGEAATGLEALALARQLQPRLLLLDVAMPQASGLEIIEELRRWAPDTAIVILTGLAARQLLRHTLDAGARGLFLKGENPGHWVPLLVEIAGGATRLSPAAEARLSEAETHQPLTRRELQVLHALTRGYGNAMIAKRLGVSASTVDKHRTSLMRKLGAHSIAELLAIALREGLLDAARHV